MVLSGSMNLRLVCCLWKEKGVLIIVICQDTGCFSDTVKFNFSMNTIRYLCKTTGCFNESMMQCCLCNMSVSVIPWIRSDPSTELSPRAKHLCSASDHGAQAHYILILLSCVKTLTRITSVPDAPWTCANSQVIQESKSFSS